MVHTQFAASVKIFRSDSGGEYISKAFRALLASEDTLPQLSCPGAHPQNGVAERKHHTSPMPYAPPLLTSPELLSHSSLDPPSPLSVESPAVSTSSSSLPPAHPPVCLLYHHRDSTVTPLVPVLSDASPTIDPAPEVSFPPYSL
ncbi:uncharacterized protein LOC120273153 [Dioscorea cayenensis subsp. rotundata]|uniref:Uncharacterized protein LOC120273153 n=1 Tax=Dioscorea cayennensis subsp. rotundata TaxID=55577 RepID=A0AB40C7G0_DIOCR|nr:uncharacterized protein LOC120273153 [Dioscorea cayenensis subsp. rotundata]